MKYQRLNIIFCITFITILLTGCSLIKTEKIDLLSRQGLDKETEFFNSKNFSSFSKTIAPYNASYLIKNLGTSRLNLIVLGAIKLNPKKIYELKMRFTGQEGNRIVLNGHEFSQGKLIKNSTLMNTNSYLNVNGITTYAKKFATSPLSDKLIPSLTIIRPRTGNRNEFYIEELSISPIENIKTAPKNIKNLNLAKEFDFSKYPVGNFAKIYKGNGENVKKWSNVKAEIILDKGEKVLHITRRPENYIYPYICLNDFHINPENHFIKVSFKVKGKGVIRPGLWWKRTALGFDYYHNVEVKLTDQWQTVTFLHPCLTPDVKSSVLSFSSSGNGEFFIKDILVSIE